MSGETCLPQTLGDWHLLAFYYLGTAAGWSREKCEREAEFYWPLSYCKIKGIEMGMQWAVLGWLAARYARRLSTADLADELWEVIKASPQGHGHGRDGPWQRRQVIGIAQRARRFIERADAAEAEFDRQYWLAAQPWLRTLELPPLTFAQAHRQMRKYGVRP